MNLIVNTRLNFLMAGRPLVTMQTQNIDYNHLLATEGTNLGL